MPVAALRYDCNAEYAFWEVAWSPDWKEWCCNEVGRGCPESTTAEPVVTEQSEQAPQDAEQSQDSAAAQEEEEQESIAEAKPVPDEAPTESEADEPAPEAEKPAPETEEPALEAEKTAPETEEPAPDAEQPAPEAEEPAHAEAQDTEGVEPEGVEPLLPEEPQDTTTSLWWDPCEEGCELDGLYASCRDRMTWSADVEVKDEEDPQQAAFDLVSSQCGNCGQCQKELAFAQKFEVSPTGLAVAAPVFRGAPVLLGAGFLILGVVGMAVAQGRRVQQWRGRQAATVASQFEIHSLLEKDSLQV
jgi:hypothetical protein